MKANIFTFLLLMGLSLVGFAQNRYEGRPTIIDKNNNPGEVIDELPLPPPGVKGTTYLSENWHFGKIHLTNGLILSGYLLRFDVQRNNLEVKTEKEVKICPYHLIDKFYLYDYNSADSTLFVKSDKFQFKDNSSLLGFFEIIFKGSYSLVNYYETNVQQPNYVEAFDVGDRDKKIVIESDQYLLHNNTVLCEFRSKIKRMKNCLPGNYNSYKAYMKEHNIKLKNKEGKIKFLSYLNEVN